MMVGDHRPDTQERKNDLLVRIGGAETSSQFPNKNEENARLEEKITRKQKLLVTLQKKLATLVKKLEGFRRDRQSLEGAIERAKQKKIASEKEILDGEKSTAESLLLAGRLQKDAGEAETRIRELQAQVNSINDKQKKIQKEYDSAVATGAISATTKEKQKSGLKDQELYSQQLEKVLHSDSFVTKELENYLTRMAKQVFDQQRRVDVLRMGLTMQPSDIEEARKALREEHRKMVKIREKVVQSMRGMDLLGTSEKDKGEAEDGVTVETRDEATPASASETRRLKSAIRRRNAEIERLERKWTSLQDKISSCEVEVARALARKEQRQNRLKRYNTKIEILKLEPFEQHLENSTKGRKKAKGNSLKETLAIEKKKQYEMSKELAKRLAEKVKSVTEELVVRSTDSDSSGQPSILLDDVEFERLDLQRERVHVSLLLKRVQFVASTASTTNKELQKEVKDIEDHVSRLEIEVTQCEHRTSKIMEESKSKKTHRDILRGQVEELKKEALRAKRERDETIKRIEKERSEKIIFSRKEIDELTVTKSKHEIEKNILKLELQDLKTSIANISHKHATMVAWTNTRDLKGFDALGKEVEAMQEKVSESEGCLHNIYALSESARSKNASVKQRLEIVKSYRSEMATLEELQRQVAELNRVIEEMRNRRQAQDLQRSGRIQFED